ncbi:MAG: hypothetical protein ACOYXA_06480 [Bacteroidota bacterium]|jgi:hypothetical protein
MTIIIKKGESKKSMEAKLRKLNARKKKKGFPAHRFTGKMKIAGDPVQIQRKLRDEWG